MIGSWDKDLGLEPVQERGEGKLWVHIVLTHHPPRLPGATLVPCEASWILIHTPLRLEKCVQQFLAPYLNTSSSSNWKAVLLVPSLNIFMTCLSLLDFGP